MVMDTRGNDELMVIVECWVMKIIWCSVIINVMKLGEGWIIIWWWSLKIGNCASDDCSLVSPLNPILFTPSIVKNSFKFYIKKSIQVKYLQGKECKEEKQQIGEVAFIVSYVRLLEEEHSNLDHFSDKVNNSLHFQGF